MGKRGRNFKLSNNKKTNMYQNKNMIILNLMVE